MTALDSNSRGGEKPSGSSAGLEVLRKISLFRFLSPQELKAVASHLSLSTYAAGEVIFHKDELGTTLHIIATGSVKIYLTSEGGEEAPLAVLKAGDYFGELALLDGDLRTASAMALTRTATLTLERDEFLRFITANPQSMVAVIRALAALVRRQNTQLYSDFFKA